MLALLHLSMFPSVTMAGVVRKTEIAPVDGTPDKRMFWSIISDYDLRTGICELVDNALDRWLTDGKRKPLTVKINLNPVRQLISICDNAGGVGIEHLRVLVAPGGSRNDPKASVIGIFGVGSKRAGIALGEHVEIKTRRKNEATLAIEVTPEWLESPSWEIAAYQVPDIKPKTTEIHISKLRRQLREEDVEELRTHLGETYSWFIDQGCVLDLNGTPIERVGFDNWAYPPGYDPQCISLVSDLGTEGSVSIEMTGGLITDRDPEGENYGVYFYCNDRMIVKDLKVRDVGYYVTNEAGVPHPDASLCRVIVRLSGPAKLMPWTSNKSGINFDHAVFQGLRPQLIQMVSFFTKLSRRTKDDWASKVLSHTEGEIERTDGTQLPRGRLVLPPLPKGNKSHVEELKGKNSKQLRDMPWTLGLIEAIAAVDMLERQKLDTKNRIALILLDSNFEIALKEFIVHRHDLFPPRTYDDAKIKALFTARHLVVNEVLGKVPALQPHIAKVQHFYIQRNKLIHERATLGVTDADIASYRKTIQAVLGILFTLKFAK